MPFIYESKGASLLSSSLLNSKHILCVVSMSAAAVAGICQARAVSPSILVFGMRGGYIFYHKHGVKLDNNTHLKHFPLIYNCQGLTINMIIMILYLPLPKSEMYTYVRIVNGNNEHIYYFLWRDMFESIFLILIIKCDLNLYKRAGSLGLFSAG